MKKIILALTLMYTAVSCTVAENPTGNDGTPVPSPSSTAQAAPTATPVPTPTPSPTPVPFTYNPEAVYTVSMDTSMGNITLKMFPEQAPKAVENFVRLAAEGYYDGLTYHRVIKDFMIQGGDPLGNGTGGESIFGQPFEDEFSPTLTFNRKGLLAMANSGVNTNGSQFFITLVPTYWLNNKHTIFGEVTGGMDVVEAIGRTSTDSGNKPLTPVVMTKVTVSQ